MKLEILGDSILNSIITDYTINRFDDSLEIISIKTTLLKKNNLIRLAKIINLDQFIILGSKDNILEDIFIKLGLKFNDIPSKTELIAIPKENLDSIKYEYEKIKLYEYEKTIQFMLLF